jgi:hypothetical protein
MVLLGLGAIPNTGFDHDLEKDERGGLITDLFLKTNKKNVIKNYLITFNI